MHVVDRLWFVQFGPSIRLAVLATQRAYKCPGVLLERQGERTRGGRRKSIGTLFPTPLRNPPHTYRLSNGDGYLPPMGVTAATRKTN